MIVLPTRRKLERQRERLYAQLKNILLTSSIHQVENIMRQIHAINLRLKNYFQRDMNHEIKEIFIDPEEDNDITTQDTTTGEVSPSFQELAQIEADIKEGKI